MRDTKSRTRPSGRHVAAAIAGASLLALVLAGCGASSGSTSSGDAAAPAGSGATGGDTAAAPSGGDDAKAASINVCALLTAADAQAIGTATHLTPRPNVTYKLMTEKPEKTASASLCTLTIYNELPDGTSEHEAIVTVMVEPAKYVDTLSGKKMTGGPGDAAYDEGGFDQVISGGYLLESQSSQGASRELIDDMYRAMIPNLEKQLASS